MTAPDRCEVAVVGGGLVGAAMALGLHRLGVDVRLIDRDFDRDFDHYINRDAPIPASPVAAPAGDDYDLRVYAISPASQGLLQQLGVWEAILARRAAAYIGMRIWGEDPRQALNFDAVDARLPQLGHIIESRVIQRALWQALPAAQVEAGRSAQTLDITPGEALLTLDDGRRLQAALVIAADGAQSALRIARGIESVHHAYAQTAIVAHVRTEQPHRGIARQRFLPSGPLALLPLADGRCSIVWSTTQADALLRLDDAAFCSAVAQASGHALGGVLATTRRVRFPLAMHLAESFVLSRFALIGDAAHGVHPLAGQGVNLGFGDVAALLELIGRQRQNTRDPGCDLGTLRMLQRYQRARRTAALEMIAVTDSLYRLWRLPLPGVDRLLALGLRGLNVLTPAKGWLVRRACGL